jgi:xanthine dehydrogenase accessory factor
MRAELLELAAELARRGEPFVLAMVVRKESYSSAQQGDMAIITADGGYHGWLGGNCTQPTVKREARLALADGKPRLVSLSPDPSRDQRPGMSALPMTCHSGGTVEIYLEPVLPPPRLVLFGESPAVRALDALGRAMGWAVDVVTDARPVPASTPARDVYAVVATMGESDEASVEAALAARPVYLGVVASRKRYAEVRDTLLARGVPAAALDAVHNPAGLDIGARRPEELAVSILAEIVKLRGAATAPVQKEAEKEAIDPVCHMTVVVATAKHVAEHAGVTYHFCNPRCREKFLAQPARYLMAVAEPA